jgi:hypothetical protein
MFISCTSLNIALGLTIGGSRPATWRLRQS